MRSILHAFLGAVFWLTAVSSQGAESGLGALRAPGVLDFRVTIPKVMQLQHFDHPAALVVSPGDAARGEVIVEGGRIAIVCNHVLGYILRAGLAAGPAEAADIEGLVLPVHTEGTQRVTMPAMVGLPQPGPSQVRYRIRLMPGTAPGNYAWPLSLHLQEL